MASEEVLDLDDRPVRVDHPEVGDGVDPRRDVVAGDHLLRRDVQGHRPQVDPHHPVDHRDQEDQPGPLLGDQAAEPEETPRWYSRSTRIAKASPITTKSAMTAMTASAALTGCHCPCRRPLDRCPRPRAWVLILDRGSDVSLGSRPREPLTEKRSRVCSKRGRLAVPRAVAGVRQPAGSGVAPGRSRASEHAREPVAARAASPPTRDRDPLAVAEQAPGCASRPRRAPPFGG